MSTRLAGHTLVREGAAHFIDDDGQPRRYWQNWQGVGGTGRGLCSCGAYSDELPSAYQRKIWHREHKRASV